MRRSQHDFWCWLEITLNFFIFLPTKQLAGIFHQLINLFSFPSASIIYIYLELERNCRHCAAYDLSRTIENSMAASCFHKTFKMAIIILALVLMGAAGSSSSQLSPNFYNNKCPQLLTAVRSILKSQISKERRMGASLLRLHFHDCFVNVRKLNFQLYIYIYSTLSFSLNILWYCQLWI